MNEKIMKNTKVFYSQYGLKQLYRLSGIYFLIHDGKIDYIGRSVNIGNRLMSHHVFDRNYHEIIGVYEIPFQDWYGMKTLELKLIHELKPPSNINGTILQSIMQTGKKIKKHETN